MIIKKIPPSIRFQPFIKYYLYLDDVKLVGKFKMISIHDVEMYFVFRPTKVIVRNSVFEYQKVF